MSSGGGDARLKGVYSFNGLARVSWGDPAVAAIVETAQRRTAERVLVVTSPSLARVSATSWAASRTSGKS